MRESKKNRRQPRENGFGGGGTGSSPQERAGWRRFLPGQNLGLILTFLLALVGIYFVLIAGEKPLGIEIGEPAPRDFRAPVAFESVDLDRTRRLREQARQDAPMVFRPSRQDYMASRDALLSALEQGSIEPVRSRIEDTGTAEDVAGVADVLAGQREEIREATENLADQVVVDPEEWQRNPLQKHKPAVIVTEDGSEGSVGPGRRIVQLKPDEKQFRQVFAGALQELSEPERKQAHRFLATCLAPTVRLDREATQNREEAAANRMQPETVQFPRGAVILKRGTEVRRQHIEHLEAARASYAESALGRRVRFQQRIGLGVVLLVLVAAAGYYIYTYRFDLMRSRLQRVSFAVLTLALVAGARALVVSDVSTLLTPVPLVVMVMCLVYDQRFGFEMAVFYGLLVGLAQGGGSFDFVVLMLGSMTAAFLTGDVRTRSSLIKAGLVIGGVQWAAALGLGLLTGNGEPVLELQFWRSPLFADALWGLANGVMSGFLVSGLLPAIERLFGVTTDIRLLEWSDPNQPLLQRLLLEAPGTYHHSMLVGSLSADAAEAIGANPLLARVSAYFHDIGKLKKPQYFGENIPKDQKNPHEDLSPTMSKLILTAHPRDGADMADKEGMPHEVQRVILESHGSTMTKFFWNRAREEAEDEEKQPQESTFRYRLPKPQGKEAACVMLADSAEGATRSLESPSSRQISDQVHEIILDRLHDGQLDESGLTITDLSMIEKTLVRGLNAVFHKRIRYPGQEDDSDVEAEEDNAEISDRDREPAKSGSV